MTVVTKFGFNDSGLVMTEQVWDDIFGRSGSGVLAHYAEECQLTATGANKQTTIQTGMVNVAGGWAEVTVDDAATHADNASGNPRIDRVVLRRDNAANTVVRAILQGTPAASPTAPALTQNYGASGVYEISLGQVLLANGYTVISQTDITDERSDYVLCGYVGNRITRVHREYIAAREFEAALNTPTFDAFGTAAGQLDCPAWALDGAGADESVNATFMLPSTWSGGAITPIVHWAPSSGAAGNVEFTLITADIDGTAQIDAAGTSNATVAATPAVADQHTETTLTAFTPATAQFLQRPGIRRTSANAGDTYAADVWVVGLELLIPVYA